MTSNQQPLTLSEEIDQILNSGAFAPSVKTAIKPDDKVVGILSDKEKAIDTVRSRIIEAHNNFINNLENKKRGVDKNVDNQVDAFQNDIGKLNELITASIKERLPEARAAIYFGLRENYQIVKITPAYQIGGFTIIFGDPADCENCPAKNICPDYLSKEESAEKE